MDGEVEGVDRGDLPTVRVSPVAVMAGLLSSGGTGVLARVCVIVCMGINLRITAARY